MSSQEFSFTGSKNGISYNTFRENGKYTTTFGGQGVEGQFQFPDSLLQQSTNPLEILRSAIFAQDIPSQSEYDSNKIFSTSTYFV